LLNSGVIDPTKVNTHCSWRMLPVFASLFLSMNVSFSEKPESKEKTAGAGDGRPGGMGDIILIFGQSFSMAALTELLFFLVFLTSLISIRLPKKQTYCDFICSCRDFAFVTKFISRYSLYKLNLCQFWNV
jgi:hypothetical protein